VGVRVTARRRGGCSSARVVVACALAAFWPLVSIAGAVAEVFLIRGRHQPVALLTLCSLAVVTGSALMLIGVLGVERELERRRSTPTFTDRANGALSLSGAPDGECAPGDDNAVLDRNMLPLTGDDRARLDASFAAIVEGTDAP
jgi:hypothetical protein